MLLLRRLAARHRGLLVAAAAASSSAALLAAAAHSSDSSVTVSAPILDLVKSAFPVSLPADGLPVKNNFIGSSFGPLAKEQSGDGHDDSKPCGQCLCRDSIANAIAAVSPAVVNIAVSWGDRAYLMEQSVSSGTIIDPNGTILTCAHAIVKFRGTREYSSGKVHVTLQDGREFEGTVCGADLYSDVAVLKIDSKTPLPAAKLGSSSKLRPGDWVVALGCPLFLQNTATAGIVSCVDRKSSDIGLRGARREYLQTDCAINQGNSGGPLVNLSGEIVGINVFKVADADGLSFAVPSDSVVKIVDSLERKGRVARPWLGLKMLNLNSMVIAELRERDDSFPDVSRGVLVPMVVPGSPAALAGFRPGDVVIEFGGKEVKSIKEGI